MTVHVECDINRDDVKEEAESLDKLWSEEKVCLVQQAEFERLGQYGTNQVILQKLQCFSKYLGRIIRVM